MNESVSLGSNHNTFKQYVDLQLSYLSSIFSGDLHECDAEISSYRYALSSLPRSTPLHAFCVDGLAMTSLVRYILSGQQDDLEQSILGFTETILSFPLHPFTDINQAFYGLTVAISLRADKSRHPDDVKYSTMYLRYLRRQQHDVPTDFPIPVTANLVGSSALQVEELGEMDRDIEEMADLCNDLLDCDISPDSLIDPIMAFARTVRARSEENFGVRIPSEKVIRCLQTAIKRLPRSHENSDVLVESLFYRFYLTESDDDHEEGMAILDELISFHGLGDIPSSSQETALWSAFGFSIFRFQRSGKPEHLE